MDQLIILPPEILRTINSYTYFPYVGYENISQQIQVLVKDIKDLKSQKLKILFTIDNFIFPVQRLLYRWLCLDENEDILRYIESQTYIDFDITTSKTQFDSIVETFTHHQMMKFHKYCIES